MDVFVARHPIFSADQQVCGYELLFRSGPENAFSGADGDVASSRVISDSLAVFGLDALTNGKRAFMKITRGTLIRGDFALLPSSSVVMELLGNVKPDAEVIAACRELKRAGYQLALDNFVDPDGYRPLIELADYLKVDFRRTDEAERRRLIQCYGGSCRLVGQKVETLDEVRQAVALGYGYFQGFFFCKPEMVRRQEIPAFKVNYLRFIQKMAEPTLDFDELEEMVKREVSLSVKLLRFLNSAAFGIRNDVKSVKQALVFLGETQVKKWATMLAVDELGEDRPTELVVTALVRARLCELVAPIAGLGDFQHHLFLVGMLSLVDAMVGRPIAEVVDEMALAQEIRTGLLEPDSVLGRVLALAVDLERADWSAAAAVGEELGIEDGLIPPLYSEAVEWVQSAFGA